MITGAYAGTYRVYDGYRMEIVIEAVLYDGIALRQYSWERKEYPGFVYRYERKWDVRLGQRVDLEPLL